MAYPTLFADKDQAVKELRRDRLVSAAANLFPGVPLDDDYLWRKLMAAEAQASRALRTFFTPRQVYSTYSDTGTMAMVNASPLPLYEEPGYDFDPSMFMGGAWGAIELRNRPAIAVQSIAFNYPQQVDTIFQVPLEWLRMDKKYGRIQFVPLGTFLTGQLGTYILSAIGSYQMPLMVQVAYTAGLTNAVEQYPDLTDTIKKMAVLSIIEDQYLPASASTSIDGGSQSLSFDADKYQDGIDKRLTRLRQSIQGIMLGVC